MYNLTTGWWACLRGNSSAVQGNYGTLGVTAAANMPGARYVHAMTIDSSNRMVYLLGGYGIDAAGTESNLLIVPFDWLNERNSMFSIGRLNDLWVYDLKTGWWMWLSGRSSVNERGSYGTLGVAAAENMPGAREGHSMVFDGTNRVLYVMGGIGYDADGTSS